MLVKTGDILLRDDVQYEVIIADDNIFVIGKMRYTKRDGWITSYTKTEIYSNLESINTLEQLRFVKRGK